MVTKLPTMQSEFASKEEYWYSQWLNELQAAGYIKEWLYQIPYKVLDATSISIWKLEDLNYTADFCIHWNASAHGLFFDTGDGSLSLKAADKPRLHYAERVINEENSEHYVSIIDIKGSFIGVHNNSAITFPLIRKILYDKHGVFVNMIKPLDARGLFSSTFSPLSIYLTDKTRVERKTQFVKRTLQEYLTICETVKDIKTKVTRTKTKTKV